MYVIDTSKDSSEESLDSIKEFIIKDLPAYELSTKASRMGIVSFGSSPKTELKLAQGTSSKYVLAALKNIASTQTSGDLSKALGYIENNFDWSSTESNPNPKVAVLFVTSIKDKLPSDVVSSINKLKKTAKVIVVSVGSEIEKDELDKLPTDPNHSFVVKKPNELPNVISGYKQAIAEATGKLRRLFFSENKVIVQF